MGASLKWIVPSVALALAPLSGCASLPVYGPWVINDFCGNTWDDQPDWTRTEAPANANLYRQSARESDATGTRTPDYREFWFAAPDGRVKFCLTSLKRPEGRRHWCNPRLADWWIFRNTDAGLVIEQSQSPVCLT
jgi:hypothetical protein